jgi:predicted sugar kinase
MRISEIADRLKFIAPTPVVIIAGARTERPGKTMAGIARAAFNTGAFVVDSGLGTQIERFC